MDDKIKVMVVDDSLPFRGILSSVLSENPRIIITGTAYNGKMALNRMEIEGVPDVIILDYEMPEMDGFQTLKIIRSKYPNLGVIMLSSFAEKEDGHFAARARELQADAVLHKEQEGKNREENIENIKSSLVTKIIECYERKKGSAKKDKAPPASGKK
jgi:two-component system, chemotaxis family, protein-glutamate methylesterase/glutaminase